MKYSYNSQGLLSEKICEFNSLASRLPRDDKSNLEEIAKQNTFSTKYSYDKYNQLISAGSSDGKAYSYNFDPIGNRLSDEKTKYAYNKLNQIVSSEISDMKSDAASEKAGKYFIYDSYGNLTKSPGCEYRYDLHNRLCEVRKTDGTIVKYSYDPLGQRVKSEEITTNHTKHTNYLMTGMVELARNVDGETQFHTLGLDLSGSLTATGGVGAVLSSTEIQNSEFKTQNYLFDGNGNVIAACDSSGTITAKLAYSPFGEQLDGPNLPFAFSTKPVDASGLVYYGFRFYNPEFGRWLSRDPIGEGGGWNTYAFVDNIPMNRYDIYGTACYDCNRTIESFKNISADNVADKYVVNNIKKLLDLNESISFEYFSKPGLSNSTYMASAEGSECPTGMVKDPVCMREAQIDYLKCHAVCGVIYAATLVPCAIICYFAPLTPPCIICVAAATTAYGACVAKCEIDYAADKAKCPCICPTK